MTHPSFWTEDVTLAHEVAGDRAQPPDGRSWPALPLHRPEPPGAGRPDTGHPDTGRPDTGRPGAAQRDVTQRDATQRDATRPGTAHPDLSPRRIAWLLANQLAAATRAAGLQTVQGLRFQPAPTAVLSPDVAVGRFPRAGRPPEIVLVADVVHPGAAARAPFYAAAAVDWYLVAEPDAITGGVTLRLLRREATAYARHTVAQRGQILTSRQPFPLAVSTTALVHPGPRR